MKYLAILVFILLTQIISAQQVIRTIYQDLVSTLITISEIQENLRCNSNLENHPVYSANTFFIVDTLNIKEEEMISDSSGLIIISTAKNLEIYAINYWVYLNELETLSKDAFSISFATQSSRYIDSATYIKGYAIIEKEGSKWQVSQFESNLYSFLTPVMKAAKFCYKSQVVCNGERKWIDTIKNNNLFYGDWQYVLCGDYYESFFSDDTLYIYNEWGYHRLFNYGYAPSESILTLTGPENGKTNYDYITLNTDSI